MPGKKKKFIDKKNAVTFHLVHRSQKDPLQASEEASKHVLVQGGDTDKRKEEQRKWGIFFEDDYDYMQHLRDLDEIRAVEPVAQARQKTEKHDDKEEPTLQLPSSVFGSEVEKDVGLLNEAVEIKGPQPDWDPDIVAALDEDFDYEDPDNLLEDDFILKANQGEAQDGIIGEGEEGDWSDVASDEAAMSDDNFGSDYSDDREHMFMEEETKSRFTNYSMTSSVIRRNEGLTLLDDRFEKFYEGYDDSEIGALDQDDIDGSIQHSSVMLSSIMEEYEKQQTDKKCLKELVDSKEDQNIEVLSEDELSEEGEDEDLVKMVVEEDNKEKWDCESILSTYSNLYNHPKLIEEPKKVKKIELKGPHGIPSDVLSNRGLSLREINQELKEKERSDKASTYRPKGETTDERKDRKKAIKQERQERRQEKKMNKRAFAAEKQRQDKEMVNVQMNLKGIKII